MTNKDAVKEAVENAFGYSNQVLVEKAVRPRELEIAAYQYNDEVVVTNPGEISCLKIRSTPTMRNTAPAVTATRLLSQQT